MKNLLRLAPLVLAGVLLASPAALAADKVLPEVGPQTSDWEHAPNIGFLRVYTPTEQVETGDQTYYYPHTAYTVYRPSGSVAAYVRNRLSATDESPETVQLAPGKYQVKENDGRVIVPVRIVQGRTTVVSLENDRPAHDQVIGKVTVGKAD